MFDCAFERRKGQGHLEESRAERSRLNMARAGKQEPIVEIMREQEGTQG